MVNFFCRRNEKFSVFEICRKIFYSVVRFLCMRRTIVKESTGTHAPVLIEMN